MATLVLPNISEPFFAEVLRIIEDQAAAIGLQLVIQCSYNKPASKPQHCWRYAH